MTQKQLLDIGAKRPDPECDEVIEAVADALTQSISNEWKDIDRDEMRKDILAVLKDECEWDGYTLAKELDSRYWDVDSQLVEILEMASTESHRAHNSLVKRWVKERDIQPEFSIGDEVVYDCSLGRVTGRIVKIYQETAEYGIGELNTHTIIPYELATKA